MSLITWPNTSIMEELNIASCSFYLNHIQEVSYGASDDVYPKDLADPLWKATLTTTKMYHDDALEIQALINTMQDQIATFLVWNPLRPYPKEDPDGSTLGDSTVTVLAKNGDNKRLSLQGLPSGYVISRGDFISLTTRGYKLYQVVSKSITADSSGETSLIEVTPFIADAVAADDTVNLIQPAMKAMIKPGQDDDLISSEGSFSTITFDVIQRP